MSLELALWMLPGLVIGLTVHEFAHAWSASLLGDDFARRQGRVSLNPLRHLSPLGTLAIFVLPFGWGKPVLVNIYNFKHPRWDYLLSSLAGPAANVIVVGLCMAAMQWTQYSFRFGAEAALTMGRAHELVGFIAIINVVLATLNLIPIPPLDGSKIWACIIPGMKPVQRPRTMWLFLILLFGLMYTKSLDTTIEFSVDQVKSLFPKSEAAAFVKRYQEGAMALRAFQWAQAEEAFSEALAINPQSQECFAARAIARGGQHNWQGALEDMNQAIAMEDDAGYHATRAVVLRALGRTAEAKADEAQAESLRKAASQPEGSSQ
jgi:Zn-dependent protease